MDKDLSSKKLAIGFIGIGDPGSFGSEAVRALYKNKDVMQYIDKIYVKNTDKPTSIAAVKNFTKNELNCKDNKVKHAFIDKMVDECDILVTGFEKLCGYKTGKNIPFDDNFRLSLFNSNKEGIYELKKPMSRYKGLVINAVNPLEGMCYWMIKEWGLDKDRIIGFMPDTDRYNEICVEYVANMFGDDGPLTPEEENKIKRGFIIGEHSLNLVGVSSPIKIGKVPWNSARIKKFYESTVQQTKEWGLEQIRLRGTTGPDVCDPFVNLIDRIYKEINGKLDGEEIERFCSQTHYINLPHSIKQELPPKYRSKLKGLCTGVPVSFKLTSEGIRAVLDQRYAKGEFDFNFEKLSKTERPLFLKCIRKTIFGDISDEER